MRFLSWYASALGIALVLALSAVSAHAQASRTWVSGVGDDANPCSRTAPCKTFAGSISKTALGGEINCIDPGGFGAVTITKSITISCDQTESGVLVSGTNAFIVNAPAGSIVTLKGHDIECLGSGINGVEMINAGVTLHLHKLQVRNCRGANGILIAPSSGLAKVVISDSYITDNGAGTSNAGILIKPTSGAHANVAIFRSTIEANSNGIMLTDSGGGGTSNMALKDSLVAHNKDGVSISSTTSALVGTVINSMISFNTGNGALVSGGSATLRVGEASILSNATGVSSSGGTLQSFKNNMIAGNLNDGTPITAFPGPGGALQ